MADKPGISWLEVRSTEYVCCGLDPQTCLNAVKYIQLKLRRGSNIFSQTYNGLCRKHFGARNKVKHG